MSGARGEGRRTDVPLPALWFALLGGPAAWTVHLLGSYPLVPLACRMGTTAPLNILTAATALLSMAAAVTGGWAHRRARSGNGDFGAPTGADGVASADTASRTGFMGLAGLLLALLFTFAIALEGLPPFLQNPCVEGL